MNDAQEKQWKGRKKRTVNYSPEEVNLLVSEISRRQRVMFGDLKGTGLTLEHRDKIWLAIAKRINALGVAKRSVKELKRKWVVLKAELKKKDSLALHDESSSKNIVQTETNNTNYSLEEDKLISVNSSYNYSQDNQLKEDAVKLRIWNEKKELIVEELKIRKREVAIKEEKLKLKSKELCLLEQKLELKKIMFRNRQIDVIQDSVKLQY